MGLTPKDTTKSKPNRALSSWSVLFRWVETVINKKKNTKMIADNDGTRKENN